MTTRDEEREQLNILTRPIPTALARRTPDIERQQAILRQQQSQLYGRRFEPTLKARLQERPPLAPALATASDLLTGRRLGQELFNAVARVFPKTGLTPIAPMRTRPSIQQVDVEQAQFLQQTQLEIDTIDQELARLETRRVITQVLPGEVQVGTERTLAASQWHQFLDDPDERAWFDQYWEELEEEQTRRTSAVQSIEDRRKTSIALSSSRSISTYGMGILAGENAVLRVQDLLRPQLPPDMTQEELRAAFAEANVPSATSEQIIADNADNVKRAQEYLTEQRARRALLKSGLAEMELDELSELIATKRMDALLSNPGSALLLPWDWWYKLLVRQTSGIWTQGLTQLEDLPYTGAVTVGGSILNALAPGEAESQSFNTLYREGIGNGLSRWEAWGYAEDNYEGNGLRRMVVQLAADPTTIIGWEASAPLKGIPALRYIYIAERGYNRVFDRTFSALVQGTFGQLRKIQLPTQRAAMGAARDAEAFRTTMEWARDGTPMRVMGAEEARAVIGASVDYMERHPTHISAGPAVIGHTVTRQPMLDQTGLASIIADTGSALDNTVENLRDVQRILNESYAEGGTVLPDAEATQLMMQKLGLTPSPAVSESVTKILTGFRAQGRVQAQSIMSHRVPTQMRMAVFRNSLRVNRLDQINPASASYSKWAAGAANMHHIPVLNHGVSMLALADKVSYGFARSYLLFAMYSPLNIVETALKTVWAKLYPMWDANPVALLHANSAELSNVPEVFQHLELPILQPTPLDQANAVVRARLPGVSDATHRRALQAQRGAWRRILDPIDDFLIRRGNRFGLEQAANFYNQAYVRELERLAPEIMQRIYTHASAGRVMLDHWMDSATAELFIKEVARRLYTDPASVARIAEDFTPNKVDAGHVADIISRYDHLGPVFQDLFLDLARRGKLFPQLLQRQFQDAMEEMIWQTVFSDPQIFRTRLTQVVDAILANPPADLAAWRTQMQALQDIDELYGSVLHQQQRDFRAYAQGFTNLEAKDTAYKEFWANTLEPYIAKGSEDASRVIAHLDNILALHYRDFKLTRPKLKDYRELLELHRQHVAGIRQARSAQHEYERTMLDERRVLETQIRTAGGTPNVDNELMRDWWDRFYAGRDAIWDTFEETNTQLIADMAGLGEKLDMVQLPPVRTMKAPLTPNDIAYLYGVEPRLITSMVYMPELMALRTKKQFVNTIYKRAERWAKKAEGWAKRTDQLATPEMFGITKDALGTLYDDILRRARIEPGIKGAAAPRFAQWDALRADLLRYGQAKNLVMHPESEEAIELYATQVLKAMLDDPVTRPMMPQMAAGSLSRDLATGKVLPDYGSTSDMKALMTRESPPEIRRLVELWFGKNEVMFGIEDRYLQALGRAATADPAYRQLVREQLLQRFPDGKLTVFRGQSDPNLDPLLGREYVNVTTDREVALQFQRRFNVQPGTPTLDMIVIDVNDVVAIASVTESELIVPAKVIAHASLYPRPRVGVTQETMRIAAEERNALIQRETELRHELQRLEGSSEMRVLRQEYDSVLDDLGSSGLKDNQIARDAAYARITDITDRMTAITEPKRVELESVMDQIEGAPAALDWLSVRQRAWDNARREYDLTFPNYDNAHFLTPALRFLMPFWTYESHRWQYLLRTWLKTPGAYTAWGKYTDNTDQGYIPNILGSNLDLNPLRGGIMMGGLRRLVMRDNPDFYDRYPGFANMIDQMSRWGCYPNIFVSGLMASPLSNKMGQNQFGELIPPLARAPLELLTIAAPESAAVRELREIFLPSRFRDYMVAQVITDSGGDGISMLDKLLTGIKLTPDEQKQWDRAQPKTSGLQLAFDQMGLFRFKPNEMRRAQQLAAQVIYEHTGVTPLLQEQASRAGYRLEDFISFPPELNDELKMLDDIARWRGIASHLGESEVGREMALQRMFWDRVSEERDRAVQDQLALDTRIRAGQINLTTWDKGRRDIDARTPQYVESLQKDPLFTGLSVTMDQRQAFAQSHRLPPILLSPEEELLQLYLAKRPEDFEIWDDELHAYTTDWSGFYKWRKVIEQSLPDQERALFTTRLRRWDTDLQRIRRDDYDTYIRPYKDAFSYVLSTLDPNAQDTVKRFYFTDDPRERELLRAQVDVNGLGIVAQFQATLSSTRRGLRQVDPDLDARLVVWGEAQDVLTPRALELERTLRREYGFPLVKE